MNNRRLWVQTTIDDYGPKAVPYIPAESVYLSHILSLVWTNRVARTSRDLPISRNLQTFSVGLFREVKWDPKLILCAKNLM